MRTNQEAADARSDEEDAVLQNLKQLLKVNAAR
jgi:hypothetical protein